MTTAALLRSTAFALGVCIAMAVSSCASATMFPVRGSVADLSALVGEWTGTYTSQDTGRGGSIWFKLVEGEDHAHGDVRMTPRGSTVPFTREIPTNQPREPLYFLGIRFVRISDIVVSGVLDEYWDPDAGCLANTTFRGRLYRERLEGTFETRLSTGVVSSGRWQASRKASR